MRLSGAAIDQLASAVGGAAVCLGVQAVVAYWRRRPSATLVLLSLVGLFVVAPAIGAIARAILRREAAERARA